MIRALAASDLPAARAIIDATGLFPSDLLDDMAAPFLSGNSEAFWLVAAGDRLTGLAYCAPEPMTAGTWNLRLIAVHPDQQGAGHGQALIRAVEAKLKEKAARVLLVETSGAPHFAGTRAFYPRCGFREEARIRDFYQAGEDKIVFWKALRTAPAG